MYSQTSLFEALAFAIPNFLLVLGQLVISSGGGNASNEIQPIVKYKKNKDWL